LMKNMYIDKIDYTIVDILNITYMIFF